MSNYDSYLKALIAVAALVVLAFSIVVSQRPLAGIQLILFILVVYLAWRFLLVFERAVDLAEEAVRKR